MVRCGDVVVWIEPRRRRNRRWRIRAHVVGFRGDVDRPNLLAVGCLGCDGVGCDREVPRVVLAWRFELRLYLHIVELRGKLDHADGGGEPGMVRRCVRFNWCTACGYMPRNGFPVDGLWFDVDLASADRVPAEQRVFIVVEWRAAHRQWSKYQCLHVDGLGGDLGHADVAGS